MLICEAGMWRETARGKLQMFEAGSRGLTYNQETEADGCGIRGTESLFYGM